MSEVIRGVTVSIGADTSKFNKEIKSMDRSIDETTKQVGLLSKSLEFQWDASKFSQAQKLAQDAINQTETKVESLKQQLKYMESVGSVDTEQYKKLQTELYRSENYVNTLKQKLQDLKDLRIEELAQKFEHVGAGITKAGQALTPFSAAAAAILASMAALGLSTVKTADEVGTLSEQLNISAEELQKWRYIAMQTDVSESDLQNGLIKLQSTLGQLATGETNKATDALMALGLSSSQAAKGMSGNFENIIMSLANMTDSTQQAALANEIFGQKLGAKIIPLLNNGSAGLNELVSEFEALGFISNEDVDALGEFDNVMNRIKYSLGQLKNDLGVALLPMMQTIAGVIQDKVVPAIRQLVEWFSNLSAKQQGLLMGTLGFVAALAPVLLIAGKLTSGIGSIVKAVGSLSQALSVIAAHPVIAIIGVVAALLAVLYNTNEQFKTSIDGLVSQLKTSLAPVFAQLMNVLQQLFAALMPLVTTLIDALMPAFNALIPVITMILNAITPLITIVATVLLTALTKVLEYIMPIIDVLVQVLGPVIEWIGQIFTDVFTAIPNLMKDVLQGIEDFVNGTIDLLNGLIDALNEVGDLLGADNIATVEHVDFSKAIQAIDTVTPKVVVAPSTAITPSQVPSASTQGTVQGVVGSTTVPAVVNNNNTVNNDYSEKNITINVTVENYAQEVDTDSLIEQINLKLAESM